ncbi:MAG: substrate-binding domain-containing protein [Chloroflexi bacterium]|nr:substrate-binding domain-containing protein [Chloroflexota bacterium]
MKRVGKSHLLTLVIGLVLGAIALGAVQAAISVTSEVRVGVKRLADGRVEVKLQQLDADQSWNDLELPPARFLTADAPVDRWRYTNPIDVTVVIEERQPPVMCVLGHAYPAEDRFWRWTLSAADVAGYQYGVDMVLYAARDSAEHAADLRDCISHDPITIATSLPYADDLREPIAEAQAAGIQVVTFNSGAEDADSVGSLLHIGLDDFAGGVRAGDEFDEAGVNGTLLCIIHEEDNVGLRDRCDGIEQSYDGGEVERISVDLSGVPDDDAEHQGHTRPQHLQSLIVERIAAGDVGAILTLNHDSAVAAMSAVEEAGSDTALASFGFSDTLADAVRDGQLLFVVWDHPVVQGYLAVSAMAMAYTLELSQLNAEVFFNGAKILIEPTLADRERASELKSMFAGPPPSPPDDAGDDSTESEEPES